MRYLPVAILAIAMIYTLVDCVRSDKRQIRAIPKTAWFLVILLLPLIGLVLWYLFGRPQVSTRTVQAPPRRPMAPDDDPQFLRTLRHQRPAPGASPKADPAAGEPKATDASDDGGGPAAGGLKDPENGPGTDPASDQGNGSDHRGGTSPS